MDELIHSDLANFIFFAAIDHKYRGAIKSLVINWINPFMSAAKMSVVLLITIIGGKLEVKHLQKNKH